MPHQAGSRPKLFVRPTLAAVAAGGDPLEAVRFFFLGGAASGLRSSPSRGVFFLLAPLGTSKEEEADSSAAPPTLAEKYLEVVRLLPRPLILSFISLAGVPAVVGRCDPAVGNNLGSAKRRGAFSDEEGRVVEAVTRKNAQLVLLGNMPISRTAERQRQKVSPAETGRDTATRPDRPDPTTGPLFQAAAY